jgi:exonuclease VII large subunit
MKSLLLFLPVVSISLWGQAAPSVAAPWDVTKSVSELAAQVAQLKPLLAQLTPQAWVEQGAPAAYVSQWQSAQKELDYLDQTARTLEKQPERLTAALDVYFRLQGVEWRLQSLSDGARKYQDPADGDRLAQAVGADATKRDQLRQYITDLARQNEQEFAVVNREAQRCRDQLNQLPPPAPAKRKAKTK